MSQNLKILVSSVTLIFLGIFADHFLISKQLASGLGQSTAENDCAQSESALAAIKQKFSGVTESDLREYLKGATAEEKLRKADEILAKMMQIFVADLGYKITSQEQSQFGKVADSKPAEKAIDTQPKSSPAPTPPAVISTTKDMRRVSVQFENIRNELQAEKAIKAISQSDFSANLKAGSNLTETMVKQITGRFAGLLTFHDQKLDSLKVEMSFEADLRDNKIRGHSDINLTNTRTGKSVSRSRGKGNLSDTYQTYNDAYMIELGGNYLELYYLPALDQFMGNYLESNKGTFTRVGTVSLQRN